MGKQHLSDAEILAQGAAAEARECADREAGLRARSVWFDHASGYVMMILSNDRLFGFSARSIPYLADASIADIASVRLSPGGDGLHWESLDVDLSVPGLLLETLGSAEIVREWARQAGRITSPARAKASRANGAKGGRPKKASAA